MCECVHIPRAHTGGQGLPRPMDPLAAGLCRARHLGTRGVQHVGTLQPSPGSSTSSFYRTNPSTPPSPGSERVSTMLRPSFTSAKMPTGRKHGTARSRWLGGLARCSPIPGTSLVLLGGLGEVEGLPAHSDCDTPPHPPPQP